jgi:hypothetical protein
MPDHNPVDADAEDDNTRTHLHVSGAETADGRTADLTAEAVRQGHTGDHLRYILALSFAGAILGLVAVYWFVMR